MDTILQYLGIKTKHKSNAVISGTVTTFCWADSHKTSVVWGQEPYISFWFEVFQLLLLHSQGQKPWPRSMALKPKRRPESPEGLLSLYLGQTPSLCFKGLGWGPNQGLEMWLVLIEVYDRWFEIHNRLKNCVEHLCKVISVFYAKSVLYAKWQYAESSGL